MVKIIRLSLMLLISIGALNAGVHSEDLEKIEKVIVTGVGTDPDKATRNAIRNAVEQVVGTFISSDTAVKNNQLIKDEILSYSGGYAKGTKVISQEKTDDGLVAVRLEAEVVSTRLKRKIQELNITTKQIEGKSLFAEAVSRQEEKENGAELLAKVLKKYPQAAYTFDVGKPEMEDATAGKAKVSVPVTIRWDSNFVAELKQALKQVAAEEFDTVNLKDMKKISGLVNYKENNAVCFAVDGTWQNGLADHCYAVKKQLTQTQKAGSFGTKAGILWFPSKSGFSILLKFKDADGKALYTEKYQLVDNDGYVPGAGKFHLPGVVWMEAWPTPHFLIVEDGKHTINAVVSPDSKRLKDVVAIEVSMSPIPHK